MKQLIIIFSFLSLCVMGQKIDTNYNTGKTKLQYLMSNSIEVELDVLIHGIPVRDTLQVNLVCNGNRSYIYTPNKCKLYLNYNCKYFIEIVYKDYTIKLIEVDTRNAVKADWSLTAHIELSKTSQLTEYAGSWVYDDSQSTFKKVKYLIDNNKN